MLPGVPACGCHCQVSQFPRPVHGNISVYPQRAWYPPAHICARKYSVLSPFHHISPFLRFPGLQVLFLYKDIHRIDHTARWNPNAPVRYIVDNGLQGAAVLYNTVHCILSGSFPVEIPGSRIPGSQSDARIK